MSALSTPAPPKVAALLRSPLSVTSLLVCSNNLDFMPLIPDESIQLVITSPPYNIGKAYERRTDMDSFLSAQDQVIRECVRVLRPTGSICWQVGNHVSDGEVFPLDCELYHIFRRYKLQLRNRIVWHFGHGLHCRRRLSGRYETISWWTKSANYTFNLDPIRVPPKYPGKRYFKGPRAGQLSCNPLGKNPSDVWEFPNVKHNHVEKTEHPCQFPVELVERLVLSLTDEGHAVFDPYMGVGTSVVAALKHQRRGYGCDTVKKYVDIAKRRVNELRLGVLRTRPMGKPIFDPNLPRRRHDDDNLNLFAR